MVKAISFPLTVDNRVKQTLQKPYGILLVCAASFPVLYVESVFEILVLFYRESAVWTDLTNAKKLWWIKFSGSIKTTRMTMKRSNC